jgi:hypothetical protein
MVPITITAADPPTTDTPATEVQERVIDENTDWSTLTDQEMYVLGTLLVSISHTYG